LYGQALAKNQTTPTGIEVNQMEMRIIMMKIVFIWKLTGMIEHGMIEVVMHLTCMLSVKWVSSKDLNSL